MCRTVSRTVSATYIVCVYDTELVVYYGKADLDRRFLHPVHLADRSCRAYLGTEGALRAAIAFFEAHLRKHQGVKFG